MKKKGPILRIPGTIARGLGSKIVSGRLRPGILLDGEIEASEEMCVSRSAYREAIRILVAKGLVESRPKIGTRVSAQEKWHLLDPDVLSWIFTREPKTYLLASLFELRKLVEPQAAALAARRRSRAQLVEMSAALDEMARETLRTEKGRLADQSFHTVLLASSGNAFLASLSSSVSAAVAWSTIFKQRTQRLRRDPVPDHRRVYDAIAAGDGPRAHAAMFDLVDLAFTDTVEAAPKKR